MNKICIGIFIFFYLFLPLNICAQQGIHGAKTVTAANTIVNEYTAVTANITAGSTIITVANSSLNANGRFTTNLAPGDLIMIYQPVGAIIRNQFDVIQNDTTWGRIDPGNYYGCGRYEFHQVKSVPNVTTIELDCGTTYDYYAVGGTPRKVQVIRIPRFTTLTVNAGGVLTCDDWNGTVGGVLVTEVQGNTVINAGGTVDATGRGFRGGSLVGDNATAFGVNTTYSTNNALGAEKGEGVAGYQAEYDVWGGRYCRAAGANGGGGGDGHNAGGGGGGNAPNSTSATAIYSGLGIPDQSGVGWTTAWSIEPPAGTMNLRTAANSAGGGRGGYTFSGSNQNALVIPPGNAAWGGDARNYEACGLGGRPLDYSTGRLFMGGGGGAGDQNNSGGGVGGDGGGLIYLMAYGTISGSGTITSNGNNGANGQGGTGIITGIDAGGGGGAGGTVILNAIGGVANTITINTNGGNGGNQVINLTGSTNETEGPGGGGGGGYIAVSSGSPTRNSNGGNNGTTNSSAVTEFTPNGATKGCPGTNNAIITNFNIQVTPNTNLCTGASILLTATFTGTQPPGATILWYTSPTGGSPFATGSTYTTPTLISTTTYWVGSCSGWWRVPVTITVGDNTPPVTPSLPNLTGQCSVTPTAPTTTDICAGTITGTTTTTFPITAEGTTIVTWTFNDGNGNSTTANQNVIIDDITVPVTPTIADATGECSVTPTAPTTTDNCAGTITGTTTTTFPITTQGTTVVTWTFDDNNGNIITANQNVIIDDITAPVTPTIADATGECLVTPTAPTTTDICTGTITGTTTTTFPITAQGTTIVTWTFNDGNGNSTTANQNVIIDDITVPVTPTIADATGECSVTPTAPTTTDICAGTITGTTTTAFPITTQGTTVVTWTFDDGNGNSTTANQNVIIDDITVPVTPTIADATVECSVTPTAPTTTDICAGTITGTTTTTFPITTQGTTVVTWTFDDGNGNSTTVNQNVIIDDITVPVTPTIADATGECSVTPAAPTTSDNCAGTITGTTTTTFPITTQGTTVVTWTFDDNNGNTTTANQNVIIDDVTAPATPILSDATGECSMILTAPTTTDNCSGTITGTTTTSFPITVQGITVVIWTFDDGNGNSITANQNVIIDDTTAPVIPIIPDITGECSVTPTAPTTIDNCTGTITGITATSFPITAQGTTIITWAFNDGNGNTTIQTQNIILNDTLDPVPDTSPLSDLNANCTISLTPPTATDNCNGTLTATTSDPVFYNIPGNYSVIWQYTDANGNTSQQTQQIFLDECLSINENHVNEIILYPNPNHGDFILELDASVIGAQYNIISSLGIKVHTGIIISSMQNMHISGLVPGLYYLQTELNGEIISKKFIVTN